MKSLIIHTLLFFISFCSYSQTINLNQDHIIDHVRTFQLLDNSQSPYSFTQRPIDINYINKNFNTNKFSPTLLHLFKKTGKLKALPIDFNIEYNSHHPYNRNNGSMIPNRGYQHLISFGLFFELGPLSIQFKPEHVFSQNLEFDGFWDEHYRIIWAKRYNLWNHSDIPERFGDKQHNNTLIGQSSVRLNFLGMSVGLSNENIWWGPSIRNSIMMSNHARAFNHLTFNTIKPLNTGIGDFEWQLVSGRLESSGFTPPRTDIMYGNTLLYVPKINQAKELNDWRYFQGVNFSFSPKFIDGLTLGFIRWVQMYSALVEGRYYWMDGPNSYFPLFSNLFRKNDKYGSYEAQTDQAAGLYFRWLWEDSNAEIYAEFHYNDAKQNIRDLLLDSDHARAVTIGMQKLFKSKKSKNIYKFSWEWTQMEQTAGRLLRDAESWYMHAWIYHGYTNHGEVLGSSIGPGSNSHYFSINKIIENKLIGLSVEIIDQDNDFYHSAFDSANDYRRYWKDYNFHINYKNKLKNLWLSANLMYSRSLNYQWELDDLTQPYYHAGRDVNNFHLNLKLTYEIPFID
jgi:hypothetical protein